MKANAWIIPITDNLSGAVGEFELIHILPDMPKLFKVPKTPLYCQHILVWQNRVIPIMNLAFRFSAVSHQGSIIGIFAYHAEQTGQIEYGALFLNTTPRRVEVSDEQASPLPTDLQAWSAYIKCCFRETNTEKIIPILKLTQLFALSQ